MAKCASGAEIGATPREVKPIFVFGLGFSIHDTAFGTTFFTMTGFHGAHVAGGVVFIYLMLARGWSGQLTKEDHTGLEAAAIYWHFVDIVWIGLFCTLYLLK